MSLPEWLVAAVLGLVEGATEFIPVSSTGHLIVAADLLGFTGQRAGTFEIVIQLGAILAVAWLYRQRLLGAVRTARTPGPGQSLARNIAIAFVPAAVVGVVTHAYIKAYLFNPTVVAWALIAGGVAILVIERWQPVERVAELEGLDTRRALGVGLAQVLALVPGVSRSGATILGGYCLGLSRTAAAEFSFLLAIPVMVAAAGFDLVRNLGALGRADVPVFLIGFGVAFASALVVIKGFLRFVSGHDFRAFGWYRIVAGVAILAWFTRG